MALKTKASAQERAEALENLDILDSPPEDQFDRVTRMAARIFQVPLAQINFLGRDRLWTKSSHGPLQLSVTKEESFCMHTIQEPGVFVVPDATKSDQFADLPIVKNEPHIRFYAGTPLLSQDGIPLGTLAILDYKPDSCTPEEEATLRELADIVQDELQLRQAGQTIRKSERHYRRLFEESRDAILLTTPEGAFLDANPATVELFGYSREELMRLNVRRLYAHPERRKDYQHKMHDEGSVREFEVTLKRKDDTYLECLVTATARRNEQGQVTAYQDIVRDVTERKRREHQIKILNQILRHDVRNDANVIIAWASMLKAKTDDPKYREFIQYIEMASRRVVELTNSARELMETLSGDGPLDLEPVNLASILESEVNKVRTSYTKADVSIETDLPDELYVRANPMLSSVFGNLLHNAVQHNDTDVPCIRILVDERDDTVVVSIADNGPGIPDEQKEQIFGKGRKGLKTQGTGIGLYLVKTLIGLYNGDVVIRDNDDRGAVFEVTLERTPVTGE
jgi:PAS domain S-box-containing protein